MSLAGICHQAYIYLNSQKKMHRVTVTGMMNPTRICHESAMNKIGFVWKIKSEKKMATAATIIKLTWICHEFSQIYVWKIDRERQMVTATRIMKLAWICPETSVAAPHESDMETGVHFTSYVWFFWSHVYGLTWKWHEFAITLISSLDGPLNEIFGLIHVVSLILFQGKMAKYNGVETCVKSTWTCLNFIWSFRDASDTNDMNTKKEHLVS